MLTHAHFTEFKKTVSICYGNLFIAFQDNCRIGNGCLIFRIHYDSTKGCGFIIHSMVGCKCRDCKKCYCCYE